MILTGKQTKFRLDGQLAIDTGSWHYKFDTFISSSNGAAAVSKTPFQKRGHKFRHRYQIAKWLGPYDVVWARLPIQLRPKKFLSTHLRAASRFWKFLRFLGPKSWIRGPNCLRLKSYLEVYQSNKSLTCVWKMDLFELFGRRFSPEISLRVGLTDALKTAGHRLWYMRA